TSSGKCRASSASCAAACSGPTNLAQLQSERRGESAVLSPLGSLQEPAEKPRAGAVGPRPAPRRPEPAHHRRLFPVGKGVAQPASLPVARQALVEVVLVPLPTQTARHGHLGPAPPKALHRAVHNVPSSVSWVTRRHIGHHLPAARACGRKLM